MADLQAITDFLCDELLQPRTILIANITPELEFHTSVEFFEDLKKLLGYKKRKTLVQADNIQMELCEFNQYNTFCNYLDRIDQCATAVVNWMPACCMPPSLTIQS